MLCKEYHNNEYGYTRPILSKQCKMCHFWHVPSCKSSTNSADNPHRINSRSSISANEGDTTFQNHFRSKTCNCFTSLVLEGHDSTPSWEWILRDLQNYTSGMDNNNKGKYQLVCESPYRLFSKDSNKCQTFPGLY